MQKEETHCEEKSGYQMGYLKGYLGKDPVLPEEEYMEGYWTGYWAGVKDANRDRCR